MRYTFYLLYIICCICLIQPVISYGQPASNKKTKVIAKIDSILPLLYNSKGAGAVVLVVQKGQVIYHKPIGMANIELEVPMSNESVFRIASLTKQFTAIAILQLMEKGLLHLNDDIKKFIPDYPTYGYNITIANLLSHTSGIKNMTEMAGIDPYFQARNSKPVELIELFRNDTLDFPPGTQYRYSNSGYVLLGFIIEKLSGKTYEQYITENIFRPLGMNNSYFDDPVKFIKNRTNGYIELQENKALNAEYMHPSFAFSSGGLAMTTGDLSKWHKGLLESKILKKETLLLAFTPYKLNNGEKIKYGFGWELKDIDGSNTIQHSGSINGYSSQQIYLPTENIYVVVLSNAVNKNTGGAAELITSLVADKPKVKTIAVPGKILESYVGVYKFKEDQPSTIRIYKERGQMYMHDSNSPRPWKMHFTSATDFYTYEVFPNNHVFTTDTNGKVTGFMIKAPMWESFIKRIE